MYFSKNVFQTQTHKHTDTHTPLKIKLKDAIQSKGEKWEGLDGKYLGDESQVQEL